MAQELLITMYDELRQIAIDHNVKIDAKDIRVLNKEKFLELGQDMRINWVQHLFITIPDKRLNYDLAFNYMMLPNSYYRDLPKHLIDRNLIYHAMNCHPFSFITLVLDNPEYITQELSESAFNHSIALFKYIPKAFVTDKMMASYAQACPIQIWDLPKGFITYDTSKVHIINLLKENNNQENKILDQKDLNRFISEIRFIPKSCEDLNLWLELMAQLTIITPNASRTIQAQTVPFIQMTLESDRPYNPAFTDSVAKIIEHGERLKMDWIEDLCEIFADDMVSRKPSKQNSKHNTHLFAL